jgi:hypothetical protein
MRSWQAATLIFFVYAAATAYASPAIPAARRGRALVSAAVGVAVLLLAIGLRPHKVLMTWVLPPMLLLIAYWTSGALYVAPMNAAERRLMSFDERLGVRRAAARLPRFIAELLEIAYAGVYPLIPVALGLHLLLAKDPDADRFWMVVLTTDYVCFGMLPWIQTRPPRALEQGDPWHTWFRRVNQRLLDHASIHVNTVPSGHAAEAVVAALLLASAPWPIVFWMTLNAAAIAAGAVLGRYHYSLDALTGFGVALLVWLLA